MPAYTYKCKTCEYTYDKRKRFSDPHDTECPECGMPVRRVINQVGVVFKGSGFYVTDTRVNGTTKSNGTSAKSGDEKKSEKKAEKSGEGKSAETTPKKAEKTPA